MGKRCQVCDGPIVNGRCKYCGMPYRNDMELYHLNMKQAKDPIAKTDQSTIVMLRQR